MHPSWSQRPSLHRRWIAIGPLLALASCLAACRDGTPRGGRWVTCNCPYLTDFDDVAKHSLDVCVPPNRTALELAQECASRVVHGPPEACTCQQQPGDPCDGTETCRSNEYK